MGPELEKKVLPVRSPDRLEAPINVDVSRDVSSVLYNSEAKLMQCMNNCEDNDFEMENISEGQAILESCEVDITDCGSSPNYGQLEECPEDVAEYSSSFGDTGPGTIIYSGVSDGEVESTYAGLGMSGSFNKGYGDVFALRKKKLTDHWRVFIQPLRGHCKWLELQMKELNAQAIKYENTLAKYEQKKHLDKKPQSDVDLVETCSGNLGFEDLLDFGNGASSLEQLLSRIEMARLHLRKVKARVEKVIGENPVKFASLNSLSVGVRDTRTGVFPNDTSPSLDANLRSPMSSLLAASKKVASSSQGDDLPDLKVPITSPYGIKRPSQEIVAAGAEMECDNNPRKGQVAKEDPVDVDQLGNLPSSKSREQWKYLELIVLI